jgi:hypothetical protein
MKFKGLEVSGTKEDYIRDILNVSHIDGYSNLKEEDLLKMSFHDVLLNWAFYFRPLLITR